MRLDKITMMTVTEQLRNIIPHLSGELPSLINKPSFYRDIFKALDVEDKKLRLSIQIFTYIISVVGEDSAEKFLTEHVRI